MTLAISHNKQESESGNPTEENSYELLDCYYSSPEDTKACLSYLLEKVTSNSIMTTKLCHIKFVHDLRTSKRTFMVT